jgi:hypothetical protein
LNHSSLASLPINGRVLEMDYMYRSGFQLGLGLLSDFDNWDTFAQYTWLRSHQDTSAGAPQSGSILPFWGHPSNVFISSAVSVASGHWFLSLDVLDLELARSYYVGTRLTFRPYFAGRAAWIKQKFTAIYDCTSHISYQVFNSSHSWGIGPEAGLTAHWLLGYGFRIIGTLEADILFTRYNLSTNEENSLLPTISAVSLYQRHLNYLRPHTNFELGLGAGSYFNNHNYHFDIIGTYSFQVFWNQNMFRNFVDDVAVGKSYLPNGDLYIHGVTATVRLDF